MQRNILITGGAGFIGSNFLELFLSNHSGYTVLNLDKLTYAGSIENIRDLSFFTNYQFLQEDINDLEKLQNIFSKYSIDGVIHFAAESHVDNSIAGPGVFIQTNIVGTFNLLEVARKNWLKAPHTPVNGKEFARFLHVSTDEVYGSLGESGLFTETTAYAPNSPYSASKASSDFLVRAYHHTYGLNTVITNCSNNYGPRQHDEKLIPTIIRKALSGSPIPIYGDGQNVRDWLYVKDHCTGIDLAFHNGKNGDTYNIGGKNERTNLYIARKICEILDKIYPRQDKKSYTEQISFVSDRPGHDKRYAIDASKIETQLSWFALENFETGIEKTIEWYIEKYT